MSDEDKKRESELSEKVKELESLVKTQSARNRVSVVGDQVIPILDELVTPDEFDEPDNEGPKHQAEEDDIDDIAEKIEQKLSIELDEIVNLLKGNLKNSIISELNDQIKKDPHKKTDT